MGDAGGTAGKPRGPPPRGRAGTPSQSLFLEEKRHEEEVLLAAGPLRGDQFDWLSFKLPIDRALALLSCVVLSSLSLVREVVS